MNLIKAASFKIRCEIIADQAPQVLVHDWETGVEVR
jgi:hypothetical protein